jgi:amino acid adenylation domain-containing protein/non-ribosomal peptide synthase protein (TIGR01720 family)
MDPQTRIFHQCAWTALEDAGYNPHAYPGLIGLYAGSIANFNWEAVTMLNREDNSIDEFTAGQLRNRDFLTTLVAHKLDLKGPAMFIQTACSTSLAAIHAASRGLLTGECGMALAGGVAVSNSGKEGYLYREGMVTSPDGRCRAFDARANGTVGGEGAGVVVLKKLKNAINDRDNIHAVIKATAINNDGVRKVGFSAPSVDGQADVIRMALKMARVHPRTISYVETHGTGTALGDPIEVEALTQAFDTGNQKHCALGSVKTNIGHLDAAAGAAGFIKTVLALKHRQIPPSLHFDTPNPKIDFDSSPFYVNTGLQEWETRDHPRRAGVSSFGIGGTNVHVILQEAPDINRIKQNKQHPALLLLSARTQPALDRLSRDLDDYLKQRPHIDLSDAAYTLQVGRKHFKYRQMTLCPPGGSIETAGARRFVLTDGKQPPHVVFMFTGLGAQYVNMGRELYENQPLFRREMDRCFQRLAALEYGHVKEILYPSSASPAVENPQPIDIAQVMVFILQYALAKLLMAWGIKPRTMIGYSFGEYAAACISGVLTLDDALELVARRGRLLAKLPAGVMLSVPLSRQKLEPYLNPRRSLAIDNGPSCIVAGSPEDMAELEAQMKKEKILCVRLPASHAIHSHMMDPVLQEFEKAASAITLNKPRIPYISNLIGEPISTDQARDPGYWARHLRETVCFAPGMTALAADKRNLFLEIGPGRELSALVARYFPDQASAPVFYLLPPAQREVSEIRFLAGRIGRLWLRGVNVDFPAYWDGRDEKPFRVSLPGYPFEKIPYPVNLNIFKLLRQAMAALPAAESQPPVPGDPGMEEPARMQTEQVLAERPDLESEYVEPDTLTEKKLAGIWRDFFGVRRIGKNDDFFDLGGDSLKAMNVANAIHRQLNVDIAVTDFFTYPTIDTLARCIDSSMKKTFQAVQPVEDKEYYPVSSAQKRLYFHHQLNAGGTFYNLAQVHPLPGEIHVPRLTTIFQQLIDRHESLRTSFHMIGGEPMQRVHPRLEFQVEEGFSQTHGGVASFVRPFDLAQAPLFRVGVMEHADKKRFLLIDMHHIITDGTSQGILVSEFMRLAANVELPAPAVRYRDYVHWRQRLYDTGDIKTQEAYWLNRFADDIPLLDLPTDFPRPAHGQRTYQGGKEAFKIEGDMLEALNRLAAAEGVTVFIFLLAVYNILLSRYSGKEDIVAGTGGAGRRHADLAGIIGLFIQVLPMRNQPTGEKSFRQFLQEVKTNALQAYENGNFPFEDLVKALDIQGRAPLNPLFDAAFELMNLDGSPGTAANTVDAPQAARYDVTVYAIKTRASIEMLLVYADELFSPDTARRMAEHFMDIMTQVLEDVDIRLLDICLRRPFGESLFVKSSAKTFVGPSGRADDYAGDRLVHAMLEDQVEKTPDAVAAVYEDHRVTYRWLNQSANALARILRAKGVGPDTLAALMVEPSIETLTGILGVLKAGGAYLPVHHETPTERFLTMLEDSRAPVVITKNPVLAKQSFVALQGLRRLEMEPYKTPPRPNIKDFDSIPFPDRSLVNYEKYNRYIGHNLIQDCISLQATRGCPYKCAYCHKIWPKTHVARSAENLFEEVRFNYNLGIRRFSFVDDIFNFDRKNSRRFFELVIEHRLDLKLFFLMRGDLLNEDYIDLMVEAGLTRLGLALETASPRLQTLIGKHLNLDKLRANIDYIAAKHPHVILELYTMHGFPSETEEEAMMTMNFIKSIKWLHFPYIFILTIFPNTEMEKLALDNGIPPEAIDRSLNLAYHELPDTLPFDKNFTIKYQSQFLDGYFLNRERLLHVLPLQMKVLTEAEMVQKYNSYLPIHIENFDHLLEFFGLRREELSVSQCMDQARVFVPQLNKKFKAAFPAIKPADNALKVLLLDLSQNFSAVHGQLDEMIEPPLGLMYLMTYLNRRLPGQIHGKIAKALIDFDSFAQLKTLLDDFQPQVIGIRTLSLYKDFFHQTVQKIRHWDIKAPIITGGPYATSSYHTVLQDPNIDLVVLGEGELTLAELIEKIIENNGALPPENRLKQIPGIAFIPGEQKRPGRWAREIITLDDLGHDFSPAWHPDSGGIAPVNKPHHLAYSIHTSGSTGLPKGVMLEHRQLSRLLYGLTQRIYNRFRHPRNIGLIAPYVFDASIKQIFASLVHGHALHIVPDNIRADGPELLRFYRRYGIDLSDGTPTLIRMILETLAHLETGAGLPLKHLLIGGETLPQQSVRELYQRTAKNREPLTVINVYGPTECTVDSASFAVTPQSLEHYGSIPIGRPMPFDIIDILDANLRPAPIGIPGEMHIRGGKLARGYLNRPELTSEIFLYKTYKSHKSHRSYKTYKTRDIARWLADGNIEFLGRKDHQVKIRGLRIELGEIETRIAALHQIKEAVVTAPNDEQGNRFLCAYITAGVPIDTAQLKRTLAHYLPDYMIPATIVQIEKLPLSPAGKIQRSALPHPAEIDNQTGPSAAPRNPIEERLLEIIQNVLGRKTIGIHENIFSVGADSIKTIQIAYGMKNLGYTVEIRDIFEHPTVAALAPRVNKTGHIPDQSIVIGEVPMSPVQEEFFQLYTIDPHHYNHSIMFYSPQRLNHTALERMIAVLQEHHDALRMTYKKTPGGKTVQWNHGLDYPTWFRAYDFANRPDAAQALWEECNRIQASIDLETGPLLKIALFRLEDGDRLLVALHHLVVDGVSWRILFEDIGTLYNHFQTHPNAQPPQLPPKSDSFKRWGQQLRRHADSPAFLEEKAYWARKEAQPVEPIQRDFPEEHAYIEDLENLSFSLTETQTEQLLTHINPALQTETSDILLTGLGEALKKVRGQERLLVALEGHGREQILEGIEVGRTVGWFTSVYPVVLDFGQTMEPVDRVSKIKQELRRVPRKGIGYGILKYITAEQNKSEIEFKLKPQIGFNYLGQFDTDIGHLGFAVAKEPPGHTHSLAGTRKYDFTVTGIVGSGRLTLSIAYSTKQYRRETIEAILSNYREIINEIIHQNQPG